MNRRTFHGTSLAAAAAVLVAAVTVVFAAGAAQQSRPAQSARPAPPPMTLQRISSDLYLVKGGSGANTAFYVSPRGVLAIDAKMSPDSAREMLGLIRSVTPLPVTDVIITHSDGDHINGLPGFPKGLTIIAQENCKADMEAAASDLPALRDYIPGTTFTDEMTLEGKGLAVVLRYYGPAHTRGDTVVYFPKEKTAFAGDLIFIGREPLIHRQKGGNSFGYVNTLRQMLAFQPSVETFLSGHADPVGRAEVEALMTSIEEKQAKVKALIAEGKSLDEIKAAFGLPEPGQAGRRFLSLVEVIYQELTEKR